MGFTLINEVGEAKVAMLTIEQKKQLTDLFIEDVDVSTAKLKTGIDRSLIKQSYAKKAAIFGKVQDIMTNGYVYSEEVSHLDDLTGEKVIDKEAVIKRSYSITNLKTQVKKFFPDCDKVAFDYNIDSIVEWHDGSGRGTWTNFVAYFK